MSTRVVHGTLVVIDALLGSSLDLTLLVPDTGSYVGFSTRVSRLVSFQCWQVRRLKIAAELNLKPPGQLPKPGASASRYWRGLNIARSPSRSTYQCACVTAR